MYKNYTHQIIKILNIALFTFLTPDIYPFHLEMHDSAGIRNVFRQGID